MAELTDWELSNNGGIVCQHLTAPAEPKWSSTISSKARHTHTHNILLHQMFQSTKKFTLLVLRKTQSDFGGAVHRN